MPELTALHVKLWEVNILKLHAPMSSVHRREEEPGDEESQARGKVLGEHRALAKKGTM